MSDDIVVVTEPVKLQPRRCWECGRWWASERFASGSLRCPICAGHEIDRRTAELVRSIASLRGALTKAKQRKSRARS